MLTLLTACSVQYQPLGSLTNPGKLEYCERHGHDFLFFKHRDPLTCWQRVDFWKRALPLNPWLWFTGADLMITNLQTPALQFCDEAAHLVIGLDVNGINCDSFFLKNCPESFEYLDRVRAGEGKVFTEQEAMASVVGLPTNGRIALGLFSSPCFEEFKVKIVPQKWFNAYPYEQFGYGPQPDKTWRPGDFVCHWPGLSFEHRMKLAKETLGKVVR